MDTRSKKHAIVVDFATFSDPRKPAARRFVKVAKEKGAAVVLLVVNPHEPGQEDIRSEDWDAIIKNSGDRPAGFFIGNAVKVMQEISNMTPVVALDDNYGGSYTDFGVLLHFMTFELEDGDFW